MIGRRRALAIAGASLLPVVPAARAQAPPWPDWLGSYAGALRYYRSIPLEDIFPPPKNPPVDLEDLAPFSAQFAARRIDGGCAIWLRIDGGPMETSSAGETLCFGPLIGGVAVLASADTKPAPRTATLTVRADYFGTEALFAHADGTFWRRHFTARVTPTGADMIVWVFDAAGTRARTWRGAAIRRR